jgi:hypothetical protein
LIAVKRCSIDLLPPVAQSHKSKSDEKKEGDQYKKNQTIDNGCQGIQLGFNAMTQCAPGNCGKGGDSPYGIKGYFEIIEGQNKTDQKCAQN